MQRDERLLIGRLAAKTGVTADAVRFYERAGLLPRPRRTKTGYRVYSAKSIARVQFIRKAQALGFSLDEIKQVLRLRDSGRLPCRSVVELAERHLRQVEDELAQLQSLRESLRGYLRHWKRTANPDTCATAQFCNLIEEVEAENAPPRRDVAGSRFKNGRRKM